MTRLSDHVYFNVMIAQEEYLRVNKRNKLDWNMNSTLRFLVLSRHSLHHLHTQVYNIWYSQLVTHLVSMLLNSGSGSENRSFYVIWP